MFRTLLIASMLALATADFSPADHKRTIRYPRVYGYSGRPYGPTQAHYQYQRRYGRAWHGYGGNTAVVSRNFTSYYPIGGVGYYGVNYGYGCVGTTYGGYGVTVVSPLGGYSGPAGFADYGPAYSFTPMAPTVLQAHPQWLGVNPHDNAVIRQGLIENDQRWNQPIRVAPAPKKKFRGKPSTVAAKARSLREQENGDMWLHRQQFAKAYVKYRSAADAAPDRGESWFRLGFVHIALGHYDAAARYFKRGLDVQPAMPTLGQSLGRIFGRDSLISRTSITHRLTLHAKEDIRDPDRLFLLGVWLYFDNQTDKSQVLFEAAHRLSGGGDHLTAFLQPVAIAPQRPAMPKVPAANDDEQPIQGPLLPPAPGR